MESGVFGGGFGRFSGGGGRVSRNFQNFREISKVVRYGFENGPIWPPKWAVMISLTTISDHFGSHIRPLWKMLMNPFHPFHVLENLFSAVSTFLFTTVNFISQRRVRENRISIVIMLLCDLPPRDYGFNLLP